MVLVHAANYVRVGCIGQSERISDNSNFENERSSFLIVVDCRRENALATDCPL